MSRSFLRLLVLGLSAITLAVPAAAADYEAYPRQQRSVPYVDRGPNPYCGPRCGCPVVAYVRHRELHQAYSYTLDPRERGEPRYYYGANRTYARYVNAKCPERSIEY